MAVRVTNMGLKTAVLRYVAAVFLTCFALSPSARPARPAQAAVPDDYYLTSVAERQAGLARALASSDAARANGNYPEAANWLNRAAWLQFRLVQTDAALDAYDRALTLLTSSPDPAIEAESLTGKSFILAHENRCREAMPILDRALSLSRQQNNGRGEAAALLVFSECQREVDQAVALAASERSLQLSQILNDGFGIASAHQSIGEFMLTLSRFTEAVDNLNTARQLWQELGLKDGETQAIIYLGFVEYRKQSWQSALSFLTQAQNQTDAEAEPYKMAQITGTMAEILNEAGMPEESLSLFAQAHDFFHRAHRTSGEITIEWDVGKAYYFLGRYPESIQAFELALSHTKAIDAGILAARCHDFLGRNYFALGDTAAALGHYQMAVEVFARAHLPLEVARTNALIGQVYQSERQFDRAREQLELALNTFNQLGDEVNQGVTLYALGNLALDQGDLSAAADLLRRSLEITERLRRNSTSADLTASFSATVYDRYEKFVGCLMKRYALGHNRDYAVQAFQASELGRGRSLAEILRGADTSLVPGLEPELAKQERDLRHLLRAKADQQVELLSQSSYRKEELDSLKAEQTQLETEYAQVTERIRQRYPAFGEIVRPAAWSLKQIQEEVIRDDQTVLIEYSLGDRQSYAWAVTRDGFQSYELPGRAAIDAAAQSVYTKMAADPVSPPGVAPAAAPGAAPSAGPGAATPANNAADLTAAQRELSRLVLAPLADQLNRPRVIVVADGVLNYIPFQSLPDPADPSRPLVDRYEVVNAASASILGALGQESTNRPRPTKLLAAFGDPVFPSNYAEVTHTGGGALVASNTTNDPWRHALRDIELTADNPNPTDIQPLLYSKDELRNLRSIAGGDRLIATQFDATREMVLNTDLSHYSILHFATHGFLDPKRPEKSGLVLSTVDPQGNPRNGYLGLQDIYSLRAPVDLVVLSACRTGLGKDVKGEGLIGLTRGFMYAGASTVVASLWKVDDEATAALMKEFYDNLLQKGLPPAAALRAAQNTIRSKPGWSSPYFWAAFTIQGEYRTPLRPITPPMAPGLAKRITAAAAILGLLTLIAYSLRRRLVLNPRTRVAE